MRLVLISFVNHFDLWKILCYYDLIPKDLNVKEQ